MTKFFFAFLLPETRPRSIKMQKRKRPISSHLDQTSLVNCLLTKKILFLALPTREIPSGQDGPTFPTWVANHNVHVGLASSCPLTDSARHQMRLLHSHTAWHSTRGQFNKTLTSVTCTCTIIYMKRCRYCFQTLKQYLQFIVQYISKSVIKLSPGFFQGWGLPHCSTGNLKKKEVNLSRQQ